MATGLADAIRQLVQDKGISEELVEKTIEEFLFAAYKRKFGTSDNAVVLFNEDHSEVSIFAQRQIVENDDLMDPVSEIELNDALRYNDEAELGDEILILIKKPKTTNPIPINHKVKLNFLSNESIRVFVDSQVFSINLKVLLILFKSVSSNTRCSFVILFILCSSIYISNYLKRLDAVTSQIHFN